MGGADSPSLQTGGREVGAPSPATSLPETHPPPSPPCVQGGEQGVGRLYTVAQRLIPENHREARISAIGTLWHGSCILIGVHTRFPGVGRLLFWSRRPPPKHKEAALLRGPLLFCRRGIPAPIRYTRLPPTRSERMPGPEGS